MDILNLDQIIRGLGVPTREVKTDIFQKGRNAYHHFPHTTISSCALAPFLPGARLKNVGLNASVC